jgi:predicted Zn-ribbon and HTH transcriptional regulator
MKTEKIQGGLNVQTWKVLVLITLATTLTGGCSTMTRSDTNADILRQREAKRRRLEAKKLHIVNVYCRACGGRFLIHGERTDKVTTCPYCEWDRIEVTTGMKGWEIQCPEHGRVIIFEPVHSDGDDALGMACPFHVPSGPNPIPPEFLP